MMHWLPEASNFRSDLRAISTGKHGSYRAGRLQHLARHNLDYLQTIQIDKVLSAFEEAETAHLPEIRVALLSSSTIDHTCPALRVAMLRRGYVCKTYVGNFGQYRQEIFDSGSNLYEFKPDIVVLSLGADAVLADIGLNSSLGHVAKTVDTAINDLRALWSAIRNASQASILQQTFVNRSDSVFGHLDRSFAAAPRRLVRQLNDRVVDETMLHGVRLIDVESAIERTGLQTWFDNTRWLQAKIEIAPMVTPLYGDLVARLIAADRGSTGKCLVVDLDNTLWGGVVGDDGLENIVIGEGSAAGEAFLSFQRYVRRLKDRGILLAVCSKNEESVAQQVFTDHPEMHLRLSDFAAFVANWEDKAQNLRAIAKDLNIGVDSLVFCDDNPAERERVRGSLPMVSVPELPDDPACYVSCVADGGYFESISFTDEDADRSNLYARNVKRKALEDSSESIEDYLANLEMRVTARRISPVDLQRAAQLINKTNQFNTTTIRRSVEEVKAIVDDENALTLCARLVDRFGDNGLVSVAILLPVDSKAAVFDIDSWVMSCRVFGRGLEYELMNLIVAASRELGCETLTARYVATEKNCIISQLYAKLGFSEITEKTTALKGTTHWSLAIDSYVPHETFIATDD